MTPVDDELLSAYLDGELADDERARVERLLAEQPESRQLLDELRAVKHSLESMPVARLGEDFADRVLRQAEREVLSGHASEESRVEGSGFSGDSTDEAISRRQVGRGTNHGPRSTVHASLDGGFSWRRVRRPLVWASLALAAGLLIMFVDRDRQRPKQVAMAPDHPEPQQRAGADKQAEIGATHAGASAAGDARPLPERGEPSAEQDSFRLSDDESRTNSAPRGRDGINPQDEASPLSRSGSGGAARRAMTDQLDENLGGQKAELKKDTERGEGWFGLGGESLGETPIVDDQTLVVWAEVSPSAPPEESFSQLLAEQNIALQPTGDVEQQLATKLAQDGRGAKAETFYYAAQSEDMPALTVDAKKLADTLQRRGLQRTDKEQKLPAVDALQAPGAQMILVEATDDQVKAVLEAMDQDRETYRTVEVEPAPQAPSQQSLAHYSRGALKLEKESAKRIGRMSVQNRAADLGQPQGRALKLQLQAGVEAAAKEKADIADNTPVPAAPAAAVPPPAEPTADAASLAVGGPKSAATRKKEAEPVYRVLFVLVPPAEEPAKPAAKAPANDADAKP